MSNCNMEHCILLSHESFVIKLNHIERYVCIHCVEWPANPIFHRDPYIIHLHDSRHAWTSGANFYNMNQYQNDHALRFCSPIGVAIFQPKAIFGWNAIFQLHSMGSLIKQVLCCCTRCSIIRYIQIWFQVPPKSKEIPGWWWWGDTFDLDYWIKDFATSHNFWIIPHISDSPHG